MNCPRTPCRATRAPASAKCGSVFPRQQRRALAQRLGSGGAALFAESVNRAALAVEAIEPVPAVPDARRTSSRERTERREFAALRRAHHAAAAQPTQSGTAVRAMREKLHHR